MIALLIKAGYLLIGSSVFRQTAPAVTRAFKYDLKVCSRRTQPLLRYNEWTRRLFLAMITLRSVQQNLFQT